jgi:prepilin-type N-terminal cleavage/methylation domain-containing protein
MTPQSKSFTLIELMIVVAIVCVVAAVAIPNMVIAHQTAEDGAAIIELLTIKTAQSMFYATDPDKDGVDFATLQELEDTTLLRLNLARSERAGFEQQLEGLLGAPIGMALGAGLGGGAFAIPTSFAKRWGRGPFQVTEGLNADRSAYLFISNPLSTIGTRIFALSSHRLTLQVHYKQTTDEYIDAIDSASTCVAPSSFIDLPTPSD